MDGFFFREIELLKLFVVGNNDTLRLRFATITENNDYLLVVVVRVVVV